MKVEILAAGLGWMAWVRLRMARQIPDR
jgi:hypothetical protein